MRILQRLLPLVGGHFWQFSKCSHFSNIRCFLEPFFCIEQLHGVVETFLAFWLAAIFGNFKNALIFRMLGVFWTRFFG